MNNFTKIVIIFLVVLALALAGFLFLDDKFNFGKDEAKTEDHACLADQGYLWCEAN